ncbi:hypothetical protein [Caenispirillum bisanense]|uniref:hypothetical protein n=1 Tax=Caenispirillum bisanense TaxID=414052 RepID=UPI0031DAFF53
MKAASPVLPQIQRPITILGLPPALFGLTSAGAFVAIALCIWSGLMPLSLPAGVAVFLILWHRFWRATRADHHHDRVLLTARRWWKGRLRSGRALVAGSARR